MLSREASYANALFNMTLEYCKENSINPFPRLERLDISSMPAANRSFSLALLPLVSTRRLRLRFPLNITPELEPDHITFFNRVMELSSHVEDLVLYGHSAKIASIKASTTCLSLMTNLRSFEIDSLLVDQAVLSSLSTLPKLQKLSWHIPPSQTLPLEKAIGRFPQLTKVNGGSSDIEHPLFIIRSLPRNQIEDLRLKLSLDEADDDELVSLCRAIVELGDKSLKIIHIEFEKPQEYYFDSLEPLTACAELMDLKITVTRASDLIIDDTDLNTIAQRLKKLQYIQLGPYQGDRGTTNITLDSLDSLALHCPDIHYIGLFILNFELRDLHRNNSRFTNDMTFEFFDSPLEEEDVFPVSFHLAAMCRPSSGRPPTVVRCRGYEWKQVRDKVKMLHSFMEGERTWGKLNARG